VATNFTFEPIIVGDLLRDYSVVWQYNSMSLTRYGFLLLLFFFSFLSLLDFASHFLPSLLGDFSPMKKKADLHH
jgi:hypothetical protein